MLILSAGPSAVLNQVLESCVNFVLASCSVPSEGPFGHEKTERRLRKLGQVYAEGTAPLPHYAPGAESLSEVRGVLVRRTYSLFRLGPASAADATARQLLHRSGALAELLLSVWYQNSRDLISRRMHSIASIYRAELSCR